MMTKDHPRDFSRGKTITISVGTPLHPTGDDPAAETAELHRVMSVDARRGDPGLPGGRAAGRVAGGSRSRYGGSAPTLAEAAQLDAAEKAERAAQASGQGPRQELI